MRRLVLTSMVHKGNMSLIIIIDETGHYKTQPLESHPSFGSRICPTFNFQGFRMAGPHDAQRVRQKVSLFPSPD